MNEKIIKYAKASIKALRNDYNTIEYVQRDAFDKAIQQIKENKNAYFMGIKNTPVISESFLNKLEKLGFIKHTTDKMSLKGRAVHGDILNPITLKPMTGSSGATGINVFSGINDLGIGTDGGGSVLCPALNLNLYSFISKKFYVDEKYEKKSTDNITFTPSIGFMAQNISIIKKAVSPFIKLSNNKTDLIKIAIPKKGQVKTPRDEDINEILKSKFIDSENISLFEIDYPQVYGNREENILFLKDGIKKYDIIASYEGPIDFYGMGDSLFGNFDEHTKDNQMKSGKGLSRVVNMVGASAVTIPANNISSGYLLISDSSDKQISNLFNVAEILPIFQHSELIKRYFIND